MNNLWRRCCLRALRLFMLCSLFLAVPLFAEDRLGGHFGVVFPLITNTDGNTTNITDHFARPRHPLRHRVLIFPLRSAALARRTPVEALSMCVSAVAAICCAECNSSLYSHCF